MPIRKTNFLFLTLLTACFLVLNFGMLTMHMDNTGRMTCPFFDSMSICPMDAFEHIAYFQNIFGAIPLNIFWFLIAFIAIILFFEGKTEHAGPKTLYRPPQRFKFGLSIFHKLSLAFSDGIIQPKLYA